MILINNYKTSTSPKAQLHLNQNIERQINLKIQVKRDFWLYAHIKPNTTKCLFKLTTHYNHLNYLQAKLNINSSQSKTCF